MKKLTVLALGLAFMGVLSLSSCKKECTCTSKIDGVTYSTTTMEVKGKCSDLNTTSTSVGVTSSVTCI